MPAASALPHWRAPRQPVGWPCPAAAALQGHSIAAHSTPPTPPDYYFFFLGSKTRRPGGWVPGISSGPSLLQHAPGLHSGALPGSPHGYSCHGHPLVRTGIISTLPAQALAWHPEEKQSRQACWGLMGRRPWPPKPPGAASLGSFSRHDSTAPFGTKVAQRG